MENKENKNNVKQRNSGIVGFSIVVKCELADKMRKAAAEQDRSVSAFIRTVLREWLGNHGF